MSLVRLWVAAWLAVAVAAAYPAAVHAQGDEPDDDETAPAEEPDEADDDDGSGFDLEEPDWGDEDEGDGADEDEELDEEPLDEDEDEEALDEEDDDERPVETEAGDDDEEEDGALGGFTTRFGPAATEPTEEDSRLLIPPLLIERQGDVRTTAVFPFYYQREEPDDFELVAGLYYHRRGAEMNADVVFPFYWSFRGVDSLTLSIPPFYYHTDDDGYDWGLAPLVFNGRSGESVHTIIPPLLTVAWADEDEAYTFAGPFWRIRNKEQINWGVFPLLWHGDDGIDSYTLAPPFYFHFSDEEDDDSTTIIPPVYHHESETDALWGLAGLLHHMHDDQGTSWTIPPLLFHYSSFGEDLRLVTPLFGYFDVDHASTLVTPLYQRHRGETELDSVAPFFFSVRDPQQHSSALVIPPLVWHFESPADATTVVFPFFGRWAETGRYSTWATPLVAHYESEEEAAAGTWVFPTFQFSHDEESSTFNFHPLVYSTEAQTHRHLVLAPIWWDFEDYEEETRATIAFPLFWRFRSGASVHQVAGNTYYRHYREGGLPGWEFHFFPLFSYGEPRPGDHFWNILLGLAGYSRTGRYAHARAFWIPFQVDGPDEPAAAALTRP